MVLAKGNRFSNIKIEGTIVGMLFSVLGLLGGILLAVGDILFDFKGKGNQKLGTSGNIDSNWLKMADWRFGASIFCAYIGCVLAGLGMVSLSEQIRTADALLGGVMLFCSYAGVIAGLYVHSLLCIQAIIYKRIMEENNFRLADHVLEGMYKTVMPTFVIGYIILMIPSVCSMIAIVRGLLDVPKWFVLLNSIVFLTIGEILRKLFPKVCYDLPGIVMPSLGLGMLGLIGIVHFI